MRFMKLFKEEIEYPSVDQYLSVLKGRLRYIFDADSVYVSESDDGVRLFASVVIGSKVYGDSYTERYRVLYSVCLKSYGTKFNAKKILSSEVVGRGRYSYISNVGDLMREMRSINVYRCYFENIESLEIEYVIEYD